MESIQIGVESLKGSRFPNTAYVVGNIAYHKDLPVGWYLECTIGGVSGSGDLSISNIAIGDVVSDGTMAWIVSKDLGVQAGQFMEI